MGEVLFGVICDRERPGSCDEWAAPFIPPSPIERGVYHAIVCLARGEGRKIGAVLWLRTPGGALPVVRTGHCYLQLHALGWAWEGEGGAAGETRKLLTEGAGKRPAPLDGMALMVYYAAEPRVARASFGKPLDCGIRNIERSAGFRPSVQAFGKEIG